MDRTLRIFHARLLAVWDHWVIEVPDADGVHAMVSSPSEAEAAARRAIAMVLDVDPASFSIVIEPA